MYATVDQVLTLVNKATATEAERVALALDIEAATRNIDRALNVYVEGHNYFCAGDTDAARRFVGTGKLHQPLDDCLSVTLVETRDAPDGDWDAWDADEWELASGSYRMPNYDSAPYNLLLSTGDTFPGFQRANAARYRAMSPARKFATVRVTAVWGFSESPPPDIVVACAEQAARWFKRAQSAQADALADVETGTLIYRQSLDPDIKRKLVDGRYYKPMVAGRR